MATELTEGAQRFLDEKRFAVLATINADGTPQQSVVWYQLQGNEIMMNTRRGRVKDRNMRRDPRISICIADEYRYLCLRGKVALDDNQDVAQADIKRLSERYHGPHKAEQQSRDLFSKEERVTLRLAIEWIEEYGFGD